MITQHESGRWSHQADDTIEIVPCNRSNFSSHSSFLWAILRAPAVSLAVIKGVRSLFLSSTYAMSLRSR